MLETHRGSGQLILNLGLAIAGLGVGYVIAGLINLWATNGQHFFFRMNTATNNEVARFETSIALL